MQVPMSLIMCERIYKASVGANHLNKYIYCLIQWNLDLRKLYNFKEVFGMTNDFLCPSNRKIYEKELRYNKTSLERTNFATGEVKVHVYVKRQTRICTT